MQQPSTCHCLYFKCRSEVPGPGSTLLTRNSLLEENEGKLPADIGLPRDREPGLETKIFLVRESSLGWEPVWDGLCLSPEALFSR